MWIRETWQNFTATLDKGGFPAWLIATIVSFILFWPLGFFMLFNMFARKGNSMCKHNHRRSMRRTGNTAFDNYREETLNRLEEERQAFSDYLQRLREARDREEFDGWMKEHKDKGDLATA